MTMHPSGVIRTAGGASRSNTEASPETISLGRPVDPPEVGAFHAGDSTSGSGASSTSGSGR